MSGWLALVGGQEFREGCTFEPHLLEAAGGEVVVLPTAAAFEHPGRIVDAAKARFEALGGTVRALDVLGRTDALDPANAKVVEEARFIYVTGGSPLHLRGVLKETPVFEAIWHAWTGGAVLAAAGAGAMVLCDPMVDPRGGAFTIGLGLIENLAVMPTFDRWTPERSRRTIGMAGKGLLLAGIDEQTALVRDPDHHWGVEGAGRVVLYRDGSEVTTQALPV